MSRLPIRLRVTLAFTVVMAVVLLAAGLFLFHRVGRELDATVDRGLRSRAGDVAALARQADLGVGSSGSSPLTQAGERLAQILDASGRVRDAPAALSGQPLLTRAEVRRALASPVLLERPRTPVAEPTRLYAIGVPTGDRPLVAVVGTSLEDRIEAQRNLGALLAVGGPIALLLASLAGYGVAAAALRPVESMRRRAAEIQAADPNQRLPVAPVRDEVSRLGDTLNEMLARLEAAFARERTFVSDASHELRTPLAILKTELELALRGERSTAELREALRSASEETDRLAQLADDLLVLARSDQEGLPIRAERVDAVQILEGVRDRFALRAADHDSEVLVTPPAPDLAVVADPMRLEQALSNLVDNALRHGGGVVELSAEPADGRVELHVRDRGPGFPEAFMDRAFDRFSRGDHARSRGGAGLGLAIVAGVAAAHGGEAGARNRPDGGSDVWVAIPAGEPGDAPSDPLSSRFHRHA
jgi:two-component system, OmpR family, sensor kinase